jgi:hypothetical protein
MLIRFRFVDAFTKAVDLTIQFMSDLWCDMFHLNFKKEYKDKVGILQCKTCGRVWLLVNKKEKND